MGKCDLSIQLDDPEAIHPGGGTVRGVVRVRADDDVTCNALEVSSVWKTHGRGNVATGESVHGELVITPRKNVSINGITLQFQACEKVVSGSGTNRTTHSNVFYDQTENLQAPTTLTLGKVNRFPFSVTVPPEAPYSLDLDDNELIWSAKLRVDIPRWPDWKKELKFSVVPSASPDEASGPPMESGRPGRAASGGAAEPGSEISFAETVGHFWNVRDDDTQAETLADAVAGLTFEVEACVERRLLYSGDEDPHVHEDGHAVWAHFPEPPLPLVLYVPHHLADEFEQIGRERWKGRGTIVGWDARHGRLQIKLEATRS